MGQNLTKSRRRWQPMQGVNTCMECHNDGYSRIRSFRPTDLILCQPCWDWIYLEDRGRAPQPTLFDGMDI
jgi:hypothetical protein